jgi:hypothetical protein
MKDDDPTKWEPYMIICLLLMILFALAVPLHC